MHYVFGSADSRDFDVLVIVDKLGMVAENKAACKIQEDLLATIYQDKPLNVNIATQAGGQLTGVFKGTIDEVNNSIIDTYMLHTQPYQLQIAKRMIRDRGIKALRAMRILLSFMSRCQHRAIVKEALNGTAVDKHRVLSQIDLAEVVELGNKNTNLIDFHKTIAFQMGQSCALNCSNLELYTKQSIGLHFPVLAPFLSRESGDQAMLEDFKKVWLATFDPAELPQKEMSST